MLPSPTGVMTCAHPQQDQGCRVLLWQPTKGTPTTAVLRAPCPPSPVTRCWRLRPCVYKKTPKLIRDKTLCSRPQCVLADGNPAALRPCRLRSGLWPEEKAWVAARLHHRPCAGAAAAGARAPGGLAEDVAEQ